MRAQPVLCGAVAVIATIAVSAREVAGRIAKAPAGVGMLTIRAIEVAASAAIVAFGVLLLAGYMAAEQLWMFARQGASFLRA